MTSEACAGRAAVVGAARRGKGRRTLAEAGRALARLGGPFLGAFPLLSPPLPAPSRAAPCKVGAPRSARLPPRPAAGGGSGSGPGRAVGIALPWRVPGRGVHGEAGRGADTRGRRGVPRGAACLTRLHPHPAP